MTDMATNFISGVSNYCDGWCGRCGFQHRCLSFRTRTILEEAEKAGLDTEAAWKQVDEEEDNYFKALEEERARQEATSPALSQQRAEFLAGLAEANRPPTREEAAAYDAAETRRRKFRDSHPLSLAAREYGRIAENVTTVLKPLLETRGEALALAALETIDRFAYLITVKTLRAVGGLADETDDLGPEDLQHSDANGTAKLVRLIVAESREAWQMLMQVGTAAADGVPAAMVRRLEQLDAELAKAFPRAMAFVRAGWDEAAVPS